MADVDHRGPRPDVTGEVNRTHAEREFNGSALIPVLEVNEVVPAAERLRSLYGERQPITHDHFELVAELVFGRAVVSARFELDLELTHGAAQRVVARAAVLLVCAYDAHVHDRRGGGSRGVDPLFELIPVPRL
jgi:hypothetical protein